MALGEARVTCELQTVALIEIDCAAAQAIDQAVSQSVVQLFSCSVYQSINQLNKTQHSAPSGQKLIELSIDNAGNMICSASAEDLPAAAAVAVYVLLFLISYLFFYFCIPFSCFLFTQLCLIPSLLRSINFGVSNFIHYNDFPSTLTLTFTFLTHLLLLLLLLLSRFALLVSSADYFRRCAIL